MAGLRNMFFVKSCVIVIVPVFAAMFVFCFRINSNNKYVCFSFSMVLDISRKHEMVLTSWEHPWPAKVKLPGVTR